MTPVVWIRGLHHWYSRCLHQPCRWAVFRLCPDCCQVSDRPPGGIAMSSSDGATLRAACLSVGVGCEGWHVIAAAESAGEATEEWL